MGRWWTEGNELSVVLNESAVRAMGLQAPVGSIIRMPWWSDFSVIKEYEIVGVVNDFHALSFRESIHPMLFIPSGGLCFLIIVYPGHTGRGRKHRPPYHGATAQDRPDISGYPDHPDRNALRSTEPIRDRRAENILVPRFRLFANLLVRHLRRRYSLHETAA